MNSTLQSKIDQFLAVRHTQEKMLQELEALRAEFVKTFPLERISNLSLDEYVQGKGDRNTFCFWIERELKQLGTMGGGTAAKFGVYFFKEDNDYRFAKKFGRSKEEAFQNVKAAIVQLLMVGRQHDLQGIHRNPIAPNFKGKILSTYFPEQYLDVYAWTHIDYFLMAILGEIPKNNNLIQQRERLMQVKQDHPTLQAWSTQEFAKFLYWSFGNPDDQTPPESPTPKTPAPAPTPEGPVLLDDSFTPSFVSTPEKEQPGSSNHAADYLARQQRNKEIGDKGEQLVLQLEKEMLKEYGLAEQVEHTATMNDSAGYDIKSYDPNGTPKYIEVKSTTAPPPVVSFFLSDNELQQARALPNYYIYVVFEVNSKQPKIWRWKNPFQSEQHTALLTPTAYKVKFQ